MSHYSLHEVINKLSEAKIYFTLHNFGSDTITILVHVPGERWEIEYFSDSVPEIEIFRSNGEIQTADASTVGELINMFRD